MNETQQRDDWHFRRLHEHAQGIARLHSLLIMRSGSIVFEEYYHGWSQNHYHNVNSVTKSVTSALVGIALRDGLLQSLDQPLLSFFPEYMPQTLDSRKQAITLRHLLSMSSGLAYVQDSWRQHSVTEKGEAYGYFWFLPQWHSHIACCAVGYGGQLIAVIPDLDTVVAITCRPESGTPPSRSIMNDMVIPALETGR